MAKGYVGKLLWVDLSKGTLKDEPLEDKFCRDFIGGYGIASRLLYSRMKGGIDPLGPENILAFMTGPFTGTPALCGTRFQVLCKSPLTGGWGDANCGGDFGPYLKFAGYDGVFFTGVSARPVYLYIENGKPELRDAGDLWGKDSFYTEDTLAERHGGKAKVACIGPAGERLSLSAAVMTYKGRAAGRSGVGAVMGSKKLKAIAVNGNGKVPVADEKQARELRRKCIKDFDNVAVAGLFRITGTAGLTAVSAHDGDSPVKNWGGVGVVDFPQAELIGGNAVMDRQMEKEGCWQCPLQCGGRMKAPAGEYRYSEGSCKPEYETLCMFGTNCLNDNLESIIMANEICNRAGLDTISTAATVAFAIECYENGIISKEDTGGLEMTWGNHSAIVAMADLIAKREGFGDVLADGTRKAAERIGKGSEKYAMNVGGQDLPAHDPKKGFNFATTYLTDATPGRHTQGAEVLNPAGLVPDFSEASFTGRGEAHRRGADIMHIVNSAGMCEFGYFSLAEIETMPAFMKAITGWDVTLDELINTGERIGNLRHAFNLREGLNPLERKFPDRVLGRPPQTAGPVAGITVDEQTMVKEYMEAMDWDPKTAKPSRTQLQKLGLDDVARDLWG
ncbi:MAG: aldehyde ferredoxin oxidoreductase family protein [Spirochaetales bacterium]|nr:aldehyde ferredoxin oxidoreductase family protein [Spirochaetales bacterium]